jgi:uncharacterized integral membrane protein
MAAPNNVKTIVAVVLGVLVLTVIFQNIRPVDTMILFWSLSLPHVVLLAIVFLLGLILGSVTTSVRRHRRSK